MTNKNSPISFQTPLIQSKLPNVGTTIFTVMSNLATQTQAINLGQGFPDFECDEQLINDVESAMRSGMNQYPVMTGIGPLREAIAQKIKALHQHNYDPNSEITVTAGGTQAILTVVLSCVRAGDEVIVIEPVYDSYIPAIELAGGRAIPVQMKAQYRANGLIASYSLPWDAIAAAINSNTRMIMINSPHNPTGMIWGKEDFNRLADLVKNTNILICSDEVYEHMVYDGAMHQSIARLPELAARSFLISSFGKTYHVTGWKVGYVAAPAPLMIEFRKTHQFNVFTVNTPMQYGLAKYMRNQNTYLDLSAFYQKKRDFLRRGLAETQFNLLPVPGTYFQCVDYSSLTIPEATLSDLDFCKWLTQEIGVAAIPLSAFHHKEYPSKVIRFCFAKKDSTLQSAINRLKRL